MKERGGGGPYSGDYGPGEESIKKKKRRTKAEMDKMDDRHTNAKKNNRNTKMKDPLPNFKKNAATSGRKSIRAAAFIKKGEKNGMHHGDLRRKKEKGRTGRAIEGAFTIEKKKNRG